MTDIKQSVTDMEYISQIRDIELRHTKADELLCEILTSLGYQDVVNAFNSMNKFYV